MLVHKMTLGVLDNIWNASGTALVAATFRTCPEATAKEWWEVRPCSRLAERISLCYPDFIPITDDNDRLIDIRDVRNEGKKERAAQKKAEMKRNAAQKGYSKFYNVGQRSDFFYFLSDSLNKAQGNEHHKNEKHQNRSERNEAAEPVQHPQHNPLLGKEN